MQKHDPLRDAWSDRQSEFGASLRAVLMKGVDPAINAALDNWHGRIMQTMVGTAEHRRFLDLGCGYGRMAAHARAAGVEDIVGVDFAMGFCRDFSRSNGDAVCADLTALPFSRGSFSGAYVVTSLMYLSQAEATKVLKSLDDCLAPGGFVLVVEPGAEFNRFARLFLRSKRTEGIVRPGFERRSFYEELAPLEWTLVAGGSNIGFTVALPLLAATAKFPRMFGRVVAAALAIDRPSLGTAPSRASTLALHRWAVFEKRR